MGGDQLVTALIGEGGERDDGEAIREAEGEAYGELIGEVQAMDGASELLRELHEDGAKTILASSAKDEEVEHYLDLLDARELVEGWTSSGDVEQTKPEPDLIEVALEKSGANGAAVMVGDSTWDVKAAQAAGVPVFNSIGELRKERGALAAIAAEEDQRRRALRASARP